MKPVVVVQNRANQQYFKGDGEWTPEIASAVDFKEVVRAFDFVLGSNLSNLDVVMDFGDPQYEIRLEANP